MANQQIVIFKVGNDNLGIDIEQVKEIISPLQVFKVPETPKFVEGLINIRDTVYTLINLRKKFNLPSKEYDENTKILVINSESSSISFLADKVDEIVWMDDSIMDKSPEKLKEFEKKCISGIANLENKSVLIFDINQFIEKIEE